MLHGDATRQRERWCETISDDGMGWANGEDVLGAIGYTSELAVLIYIL